MPSDLVQGCQETSGTPGWGPRRSAAYRYWLPSLQAVQKRRGTHSSAGAAPTAGPLAAVPTAACGAQGAGPRVSWRPTAAPPRAEAR